MTKSNLCQAKGARGAGAGGRVMIVTVGKCDPNKRVWRDETLPTQNTVPVWGRRSVCSARPPVGRNVLLSLTSVHLYSCMYTHTNTASRADAHRHMYTVHTTHSASAWLIQPSVRSLTVTNSWLTAQHKKAHTLTPNLWGGPWQGGGWPSSRPAQLSPSYLLFLPPPGSDSPFPPSVSPF